MFVALTLQLRLMILLNIVEEPVVDSIRLCMFLGRRKAIPCYAVLCDAVLCCVIRCDVMNSNTMQCCAGIAS